MNPEQIKYLLNLYGEENLKYILLNNTKRITLTEEERINKKYKFVHDKELILYDERVGSSNFKQGIPYVFIEGLIFKDGAEPNFRNDKNNSRMEIDEKTGKPVVVPANQW